MPDSIRIWTIALATSCFTTNLCEMSTTGWIVVQSLVMSKITQQKGIQMILMYSL